MSPDAPRSWCCFWSKAEPDTFGIADGDLVARTRRIAFGGLEKSHTVSCTSLDMLYAALNVQHDSNPFDKRPDPLIKAYRLMCAWSLPVRSYNAVVCRRYNEVLQAGLQSRSVSRNVAQKLNQ